MEENKNYSEVFQIDQKFLDILIFFSSKYSRELIHYTAQPSIYTPQELINDLFHKLCCKVVVVLRFHNNHTLNVDFCSPNNENVIIKKLLEKEEILSNISILFDNEQYRGKSFFLSSESIEIDLIPLPFIVGNEMNITTQQIIMLVDSALLKPISIHKSEREFQRTLIEQLIQSWLLNYVTPKAITSGEYNQLFHLSNVMIENEKIKDEVPSWLYFATLPELLRKGTNDASYIRRQSNSSNRFFRTSNDEKKFIWEKWCQRGFFNWDDKRDIQKERKLAKSLIYWCRWIGSLYDLEEEIEINSTSMNKAIQHNNQNIKVSEWVEGQRKEGKTIEKHLKELRKISAYYFGNNSNEIGI